jgi:tRNA(Ile)-lysidine synthase
MTRPTDAVRTAVRRALQGQQAGSPAPLALVACSGGPDSLALAAAAAQAAPGARWRAGAVIVDHSLQAGSQHVAARTADQCSALGLDPVIVRRVQVAAGPGPGPEAAARTARYDAFSAVARQTSASAILLGHTLDDQAETVLLGLARGSGARSLRGMALASALPLPEPEPTVVLLRPLLGLPRETVAEACTQWGLQAWSDPHNADPAYTRVRVRRTVMPALTTALGPGVPAALARTASLLRDDEDALSHLAAQCLADLPQPPPCRDVALQLPAIRRRILRLLALQAGCPAAAVNSGHLYALDALIVAGGEGGDVRLPGGVNASIRCGTLVLSAAPVPTQE